MPPRPPFGPSSTSVTRSAPGANRCLHSASVLYRASASVISKAAGASASARRRRANSLPFLDADWTWNGKTLQSVERRWFRSRVPRRDVHPVAAVGAGKYATRGQFGVIDRPARNARLSTAAPHLEDVMRCRGDRAHHWNAVRISGGDNDVLTVPRRAELHAVAGHRAAVAVGRAAWVVVRADA